MARGVGTGFWPITFYEGSEALVQDILGTGRFL